MQHEDLTAPARELGDGPPDGVVELAAQTFVLRGVRHGWLFVAGALDPRRHHAPVPQVLERPVPRRDEQVGAAQVILVGCVPQLQEEVVHDILRGCPRTHEAEDVLAEVDVVRRERRLPRRGSGACRP